MKTHLDLFSGIGGFALAAQWNDYTTVGFCEIEPYAQKVLIEKFGAVLADANGEHGRGREQPNESSRHKGGAESGAATSGGGAALADANSWKRVQSSDKIRARRNSVDDGCRPILHGDIFTLNGADYAGVDLLTGGFPCQPFSCAGKRRGKEDDRHLWPEMRRVIDEARPSWVLAENVPGIIGMELDAVLSDLENIGYACWPIVVPACAVDARHRRDRVWIVAHRDGDRRGTLRKSEAQTGTANGLVSSGERKLVADTTQGGIRRGWASGNTGQPALGGKVASDALGVGPQRQWANGVERPDPYERSPIPLRHSCDGAVWLPEPELGRVAHGIPHRSHRLKGLGNAIVPQVAAQIISMIPA